MKVKLCKLYKLESCECQQGMRFASGTIKSALERQTIGVYKYASTFPMASRNKERCNHGKKRGVKKYENMKLFLQVRN